MNTQYTIQTEKKKKQKTETKMKGKKAAPGSGDIRGWAKLAEKKTETEVEKILKEEERKYNQGKNEKFFGKDGHYEEENDEAKDGEDDDEEVEWSETETPKPEEETRDDKDEDVRMSEDNFGEEGIEAQGMKEDKQEVCTNGKENKRRSKKKKMTVQTEDEEQGGKEDMTQKEKTKARKRGADENRKIERATEVEEKTQEEDEVNEGSSKKKSKSTKRLDNKKTFKKVNSLSQNRRECTKWTELFDGEKDGTATTPDQSNSSSFFRHNKVSRVTLKITLDASDDPRGMAVQELKKFFIELVKADDTLQIYAWKDADEKKGRIRKPEKMPKTIKELQPYSSKLYVFDNKNKMTIYPMFRIGHDKPLEDIREEIREWSRDTSNRMFYNMLQCESSSEIGWFLYSTQKMDSGALADEIADVMGVNVGLRWKMINLGTKGKVPEDKKVSTIAIEVDTKYKWQAQRRFIQFYGKEIQATDYYPNGIRLRFIKAKKDAVNAKERAKLDKLRERQKAFLTTIQTTQTWDIVQLDYSAAPGQPTLRQMIMEITSEQYPGTPLFHSVDLDWRGEGYVFEYSPKMQDEAECMVNYLQPYLDHHFPNAQVLNYFTDECIERCRDIKVDEKTGQVIDINSGVAELDLEKEDGIIGFSLTFTKTAEIELAQRPEKDRAAPFPGDSDSVSTLDGARLFTNAVNASGGGNVRNFVPNPAPRVVRNEKKKGSNGEDVSVISSTSTVTWQSLKEVDNRLTTLEKNTNDKLDKIMSLLGGQKMTSEDENTASTAASQSKISSSSRGSMQETGGGLSSSGEER